MTTRSKPFEPKPWAPGARIEWAHHFPSGPPVVRTGVIWSRAPEVDGATIVAWVTPDEALPSDLYSVIAVGKATRLVAAHGHYVEEATDQYVAKGGAFSSNYGASPLGSLAVGAATIAHRTRGAA